MERIQKIMAARGVASRRACEALIAAGRVTCNGVVCAIGDTADEDQDIIMLDGKPIPPKSLLCYIILNKPRGYVTTASDEKGRRTVMDLLADCPVRVFPVGRLDMDSEGLLLLTNDGEFANQIMHPSHSIDKVYHAFVTGYSEQALEKVKRPIILDGYRIKKPDVKCLEAEGASALLEITIHEGRNRQVRRMCAAAGMRVKRLIRVREGKIELGDLKTGCWRYMSEDEIALLK